MSLEVPRSPRREKQRSASSPSVSFSAEPDVSAADTYTPACCELSFVRCLVLALFRSHEGLPKLSEAQWNTLAAVCGISLFSGFDWELLPLAIKEVQDAFHLEEGMLGYLNSIIKMGAMPAFAVAMCADMFGRRAALLVVGSFFCLATFLTGFATSLTVFVATQFISRSMIEAKSSVCTSLLLEQMDDHNRGWGLGMQQSIGALGAGLAYLVFGVFGALEEGWRYMYWLAVLQLPFLFFMFHKLPESAKYQKGANSIEGEGHEPIHVRKHSGACRLFYTMRQYPGRMFATFTISFLNGFAFSPGDLLKVKFMQEEKGLTPGQVALLVLFAGTLAFVAFTLAGRMSDKYGRKRFLKYFSISATFGVVGFYQAPGNTWIAFFFLQLLSGFVLNVVSTTYFAECFPTSIRSTAQSWLKIVSVASGILGIALESVLYEKVGNHWTLVTFFVLFSIPSPFILDCFLPETSCRSLDDISPDSSAPAVFSSVERGTYEPIVELAEL